MTADEILAQPTCSVAEAAALLGVGRGTLYEAARRGELPFVLRVGRRIRVSTAGLRAWLEGEEDVAGKAGDR